MNNNPIYNLQNNLNDVCKSRAFYAGKIVYNFQFACIIFRFCGMPLHNKKYLAIFGGLENLIYSWGILYIYYY